MTTSSLRAGVASTALLVASPALACPVCGGGGPNQQAYIDMTMFMSLLPLTLLSFISWVIWRNHKAVVRQQEEAVAQAAGGPSSSESSAAM